MIRYCIETLYHFNCELCKKWFSVGGKTPEQFMTCPHCGERQETIYNGNGHNN